MKTPTRKAAAKKIPPGLARVRKEIPPPTKVFRSKKSDQRQRRKAELRQEVEANPPGRSS